MGMRALRSPRVSATTQPQAHTPEAKRDTPSRIQRSRRVTDPFNIGFRIATDGARAVRRASLFTSLHSRKERHDPPPRLVTQKSYLTTRPDDAAGLPANVVTVPRVPSGAMGQMLMD